MILHCSLLSKRYEPPGSPSRTYAGLKLSKNCPASPLICPLFREVENGCKGTTFFQTRKRFSSFFFNFFYPD